MSTPPRFRTSLLALLAAAGGAATVYAVAPASAEPAAGPAGSVGVHPAPGELVFLQTETETFFLRDAAVTDFGGSLVVTGRAEPDNEITREDYGPATVRVPWERVVSMRGFDTPALRATVAGRKRAAEVSSMEVDEPMSEAGQDPAPYGSSGGVKWQPSVSGDDF